MVDKVCWCLHRGVSDEFVDTSLALIEWDFSVA